MPATGSVPLLSEVSSHIHERRFVLAATVALVCVAVSCDEEAPAPVAPPTAMPQQEASSPTPRSRPTRLAASLNELRRVPSEGYRPPDEAESESYRHWVGHLGTSIVERQLPVQPPPPGFTGRVIEDGRVWLLSERADENRGAGAVALRVALGVPLVLEVPHSFFDSGTLPLAISVFEQAGALALLVNTLHRGGRGPLEERAERARSGESESDVAHREQSFFHQAHLQVGRIWPRARVVQLHGFRDEKVPTAKIVVSAAGTGTDLKPLARAFNDAFGVGTAKLYPDEVKRLGGTQNAQARASRDESRDFVHLEVAGSLRQQLARQPSLRERFARALTQGLAVR